MTKLLIIADDFTGSLDTGVQFAKHGINTLVTVMKNERADLAADCQVLVVNTESRHIPAAQAYQRIASLVADAKAAGFDHFFKKTDSTMRGNIGSELAALLDQAGSDELIFIPAFPKSKRYTLEGNQYVGDQLLADTAFANDPFNPITRSDIKGLIGEQTDLAVENFFVSDYDLLRLPPKTQKTIRVVDASTDADLMHIGQTLKSAEKLEVLAGCAGFAEYLPSLLGLDLAKPASAQPQGVTLLVSGSVNPLSLKQVEFAIQHRHYASFQLSVEQKIDSQYRDPSWEQSLVEQLKQTQKAAIWSKRAESKADDASARAEQLGIVNADLGALIASNIGALVGRVLQEINVGTLIVFGGDTLLGIADQIGCHLMRPVCEIAPGVVLARFVHDQFQQNVITKAGGFGDDTVVGVIEDHLLID